MSDTERSVLLLEDDDTDALLARKALEDEDGRCSFKLKRAKTLEGALRIILQQDFDVIVADLGLPDSDGEAIVSELVAAAPKSNIIVLTGTSDHDLGRALVKRGAHEYAVKNESTYRFLPRLIEYAYERTKARSEIMRSTSMRASAIKIVQAVLSLSTEPFMLLDKNGKILVANPAFIRVTRYPLKSLVGRPITALFNAGKTDKAESRFRSALHGSERQHNGSLRLRLADGAVRAFSYWMSVISPGEDSGYVIVKFVAHNIARPGGAPPETGAMDQLASLRQ